MTTYAYDPTARHLISCVGGGAGATAHTVTRLHDRTPERLGRRLAHQLTLLSREAWLSYTDAEAIGPVPDVAALGALRTPNLPCDGWLKVEGDWVVERAHEVGRTLVEIGSAGVRRAVVDEVTDEFDSIGRASCGDLGGRAAQAVELTRHDASPTQIAAADRLLEKVPAGGEALVTDVEPTAACVAAAHWLVAAVTVTTRLLGETDEQAVLNPDDAAEPFDVVAPRAVLRIISAGGSPLTAVQDLLRPAMSLARGCVPPWESDEPGLVILDPIRPARHLLDRLMAALRTCMEVYVNLREPVDGFDTAAREFNREVRQEAARTAERLLATAASG